ncbi:hypothetical protein [Paraburkholderia bannensis]|uniref:hypothetical protein n=1 Tax=Paraburkholderia bannensis TaxID=765414 RepID=UPI001427D90E|nr:hypothetical protein [Paraburkholderia bannensis]
MSKFLIESSADDDIDEIFGVDEDAAAMILAVLEAISDNEQLQQRLFRHGHRNVANPTFDVSEVSSLFNHDYVVLRLKIWSEGGVLIPYRALYAYDGRTETYHVLGVLHRSIAYDLDHPRVKRLLAEYESLGIFPFN